jgi:hypothetical protein
VVSIVVCAVLAFTGFVRFLSYSEGAIGDFVRSSAVGFLCYDPRSLASARYFKILATPAVVALIYFLFRWRNTQAPSYPGSGGRGRFHHLDFRSPVLRGILTTVITLHWVAMEWWKFNTEDFYPWSALESRWLNIGVLVAGQALAFFTMKYLSFDPVSKDPYKTG